jgi:NTP pyrophosphatase (non-canonical NTP hydrolase)
LTAFAEDRNWQRFHTPKNLALALAGEVGELAAELQWLTPDESFDLDEDARQRLRDEIADVLIYLVRLADVTDINAVEAAHDKVTRNASRTWPTTDAS